VAVGNDTVISTETLLGASVKAGKRVKLMRWVQVGTSTGIRDQVTLAAGVVIGDNWVISDGVTIGKGARESEGDKARNC
jgi:UDP-3-O-[3-hydroxymyristoyl] glucosamine N-acyltransferase